MTTPNPILIEHTDGSIKRANKDDIDLACFTNIFSTKPPGLPRASANIIVLKYSHNRWASTDHKAIAGVA